MYDPIHDCYTSVTAPSEDEARHSPSSSSPHPQDHKFQDHEPEDGRAARSSRPSNRLTPNTYPDGNGHSGYTPSPERKRKRDASPPYNNGTYLQAVPTSLERDESKSRSPAPGVEPQNANAQLLDNPVDEQEQKRRKRYEGETDRKRRMNGQAKEVKAGPYARREMVLKDGDQPRQSSDLGAGRNSVHRRSPPHYKYREAPPPPHVALGVKLQDPDPERIPEPPRSPPRKLKRPGARYSHAEREALQKKQEEADAERERKAITEAMSRGVDEVVRSHYNAVPQRGKVWRRTDSKIKGLRSFNNWVKSTLIQKFAANEDYNPGQRYDSARLKVLDVGCGKGGDLLKWKSAPQPVELYCGIDSADISIQQAKGRFVQMTEDDKRRNRGRPMDGFHAEFFTLDAWSDRIDDISLVNDVGVDLNVGPREGWPSGGADRWGGGGFDVVSLMFCMHYAFESEEKIRGMLRNVAGSLCRGGRFIGTIPSSDIIYSSIQKDGPEFGNSLYKVSFPTAEPARKLPDDGAWRPAWGWKYSFFLEESVEDVPEYVVPWEAFRAMAYEYSLKLEYKRNFEDIWNDEKNDRVLGPLSERMNVKKRDGSGDLQVEAEEWEACKLYMGFCFRKL